MDISWGLIGTVAGSAVFGAILGKLLDAFLLSKINDNYERKKWLRQAKLEEYSKISKEFISLGFESNSHSDEQKLNAIISGSILLIEDKELVKRIQKFIKGIIEFTTSTYPEITNRANSNEIKLPSGEKAGQNELEVGYLIDKLQNEAFDIISELNIDLKKT